MRSYDSKYILLWWWKVRGHNESHMIFLQYLEIRKCSGPQTVQLYQVPYFYEQVKGFLTYHLDYLVLLIKGTWTHHLLLIWAINDAVYGIIIILDHQNTGVDIPFFVISYLVQEIWCKIYHSVMVATMWRFCDGAISIDVQGPKVYQVSCFY